MIPADFIVFEKYLNAPTNAFGSAANPESIVSDADKSSYTKIHDTLVKIAESSILDAEVSDYVKVRKMNYSPNRGARGHRPVDVWVSICGAESEVFGKMPQIYIIASVRGIEVGFAVSISEDDYHDPNVKARNRSIIPLINQKLPPANDSVIVDLDQIIADKTGWHYNTKARLLSDSSGFGKWQNLPEMISSLKSEANTSGGGSIAKYLSLENATTDSVSDLFNEATSLFLPLLLRCQPKSSDAEFILSSRIIDKASNLLEFDPGNVIDAREKLLRQIAVRRGQAKFRASLLTAYKGKCAISGVDAEAVLEAAHIVPYNGDQTNVVQNGILLRADLHTLFDLGLVQVNPTTMRVRISDALMITPYKAYNDRKIFLPVDHSKRPSVQALALRWGG